MIQRIVKVDRSGVFDGSGKLDSLVTKAAFVDVWPERLAVKSPVMIRARSHSADETRRLAARLEPLLTGGEVLLLDGDLGAGKTTFVKGLAEALGIRGRVTSPTFTLLHSYAGRLRLHHLDLYRLEGASGLVDLDLPELLGGDAVLVVEWPEILVSEIPRDFLEIRILFDDAHGVDPAEAHRLFELRPIGPTWEPREGRLESALRPAERSG
ncbi:MAG: tRNA (adenosine(37)-N6)-threonylcarbamoyltransferase complex ATPase subunit type 1 TsaE [Acidobacteriota bacterium]